VIPEGDPEIILPAPDAGGRLGLELRELSDEFGF